MSANPASPLHQLSALGQSVWVDFLSRDQIHGGALQSLIDSDAVVGATSNPTIFGKAMSQGDAYDEQMHELAGAGKDPVESFWVMAQQDVGNACDVFAPVYERTAQRDGYVSIEVDARLAYDTLTTFREAMRLHDEINRRNLLVKIPATKPSLAAIEDSIAKARSINVTLIFSLRRYEEVAESYIRGIERLIAEGGDPRSVTSVASFFVSRIDTEADRRLQEAGAPQELQGKLAIANARLAYERYEQIFSGPRWEFLAAKGAGAQRLLWASTSAKNPAYPDTMYVEELIGRDTVDTMPEETIRAYQDHGDPQLRLHGGLDEARRVFEELEAAGLDYDDVTDTLEREGVEKFTASFEDLLAALKAKQQSLTPA